MLFLNNNLESKRCKINLEAFQQQLSNPKIRIIKWMNILHKTGSLFHVNIVKECLQKLLFKNMKKYVWKFLCLREKLLIRLLVGLLKSKEFNKSKFKIKNQSLSRRLLPKNNSRLQFLQKKKKDKFQNGKQQA